MIFKNLITEIFWVNGFPCESTKSDGFRIDLIKNTELSYVSLSS